MINANELTIGNWVNDPSSINKTPNLCTILELAAEVSVNKSTGKTITKYYYLEPIPLTPEILQKAGFAVVADEWNVTESLFWSHEDCSITFSRPDLRCYVYGDNIEHIKFVHQLQNLYFALNGTELTINL